MGRTVWTLVMMGLLGCHREATPPTAPPPETVGAQATGKVVVDSEGLAADLAASRAFYGTRPVYEQPLDTSWGPVEGVEDLSAEACGTCHEAIYEEWKVSTHALAWVDPQFQEEIGKSDNRWMCDNCHTPLLAQREWLPRDLVDGDVERPVVVMNPAFDVALQQEGITCAACHVVDGVIHGPGRAVSAAAHRVVADERFTSEALCTRCHQATATYEGKSFVCTFNTGEEWRQGPYDEAGVDCRTCHMPATERPAAKDGPVRTVGRHWWRGAGIPKIEGVQPPLEANPPGLAVLASFEGEALHLTLANARAGHMLPTGDPERWVQVDVSFTDADGAAVGDAWTHRLGQRWEWSPPRQLSDNRLGPQESVQHVLEVPPAARAALVVASSHRMSVQTAEYHDLVGRYPLSIETHRLEVARP